MGEHRKPSRRRRRWPVVALAVALVLTAGIAWSFFVGFVIDRDGEVRWHGTADLVRLGVLIVAVLVGSAWWRVSAAAIYPPSEEEIRSHG